MGDSRNTAALLDAIASYLDEWQVLLRAPRVSDERVQAMREQAHGLKHRAEAAVAGGLAHHLGVCIRCLDAPSLDRRGFQEALRNVSEVAWQLKQEHAAGVAARDAGIAPRSVALPPLLVGAPPPPARSLPSDPVPPPPISIAGSGPVPDQRGAPALFGFGAVPSASAPPPALQRPSARPDKTTGPGAPGEGPRQPAEPARPAAAAPVKLDPPSPAAATKARNPGNLLVATMFGLRAFGRNKAPKAPLAPSPPPAENGGAASKGVLGLGRKSRGGPAGAPPPWIGARAGGLPELVTGGSDRAPQIGENIEPRAGRPRFGKAGGSSARSGSISAPRQSSGSVRSRWGGRPPPVEGAGFHWPWWLGLVAVAVLGLVVILLLVWRRPNPVEGVAGATGAAAPTAPAASDPVLPKSRLLDNKERLKALISLVHGYGGEESPELADLLDEEAALLDEAMTRGCSGQGDQCEGAAPIVAGTLKGEAPQNQIQHLFQERRIQSRSRGDRSVTPSWLAGLELPVIGVEDDPEVKHWVEYFTEHGVGRERFQTLLFRCGEYQDLIERTLVRHGLPTDLMALVLTESGCVPDIESPVGARGLWQFMPATARAYHLHVKEGIVDERISPPKATEAAVRYLADLYRKMGNWEFAMASYNMGPFGLAARIRRAGGDVTFWDLAAAGMLPEETAKYVPRIQGYALILKNLAHFNFSASQMRAPETTAELEVPAGTRLGQVARSVGTTLNHIKLLNPDLVGTSVPELPGARFMVHVPKDLVFRGRDSLAKLLAAGDQADRCVSSEFDWGRQRFTPQMAAQCRKDPRGSAPR